MNKAPPPVEEARKKLIEKSNKKINKEIRRLETKMDDIYQTAEDLNDDWDDGGKPEADKEELDRMGAKIENLKRKLKGGGLWGNRIKKSMKRLKRKRRQTRKRKRKKSRKKRKRRKRRKTRR